MANTLESHPIKYMVLGIDPGGKGGICAWMDGVIECHKMPDTIYDITEMARGFLANAMWKGLTPVVFLERPPLHMGEKSASGSPKLISNHGFILGTFIALGYQMHEPRPQQWQKIYGLGTRSSCASDSVWKNKLKSEAQRIYPNMKIIHAYSDALLILTYGLRKMKLVSDV